MSKDKLSPQGEAALKTGLQLIEDAAKRKFWQSDAFNKEKLARAVQALDSLQVSDAQSWEAHFYPGYISVFEAAANFSSQRLGIGNVISLLMDTLQQRSEAYKLRMEKVPGIIMDSGLNKQQKEQAITEVSNRTRELLDVCNEMIQWAFKEREKVNKATSDGGIMDGLHSWAEESKFGELWDSFCMIGYILGDGLSKYIEGDDSGFFKQHTIDVWQKSCMVNCDHIGDRSIRESYIAKVKALAPDIKVGGEFKALMNKIGLVIVLILAAIAAFIGFDVPGRVSEFFSSFGPELSDEELVEKFASASSGSFKIKGEVTGWDDKWFGKDEIYMTVQNSKRRLNITCKIDKLPTLNEGQWLRIKGKKTGRSVMDVDSWTSYTPTGAEPKYIESTKPSSAPTQTPKVEDTSVSKSAPNKEETTANASASPDLIQANNLDSSTTTDSVVSETKTETLPVVAGEDAEVASSMETFSKYVEDMKDVNHSKNWHEKYQGRTLTLKATFKKVKTKKGETTVECKVAGENVVVYMSRGNTDKAQSLSKGDVFYVRGNIAKQRWGILHTMGLSDGEIVTK